MKEKTPLAPVAPAAPAAQGVYVQYKEPAMKTKLEYSDPKAPEVSEMSEVSEVSEPVFNYQPEIKIVMTTQNRQQVQTSTVELGAVLDTVQKQSRC